MLNYDYLEQKKIIYLEHNINSCNLIKIKEIHFYFLKFSLIIIKKKEMLSILLFIYLKNI